MNLTTDTKNDKANILSIKGSIKDTDAIELSEALMELIKTEKPLIIDLTAVPFMNSASLGVILNADRRAKQTDNRLILCCLRPDVANLLEITKLKSVLTTTKTFKRAQEII